MGESANLWYFEHVDLYNILCPHLIKGDNRYNDKKIYAKNDFIYFPNEWSDTIYLIATGRVKIGSYTKEGDEIVKSILGEGDIFGELALAGEEKRTDYAQALDEGTAICQMDIGHLQSLMLNNKPLNLKIYKLIGLRLKKLERRIESMVFKDARTRIVEFLKDLAEEKGVKVGFETMIKNHYTHKDIASLTGTSRQTVTTVLNELKEDNIINFNRRQILIRDLEQLV